MNPSSSPSASRDLVPVGAWIEIEMPGMPNVVGFTYVDREAGFSAQGYELLGGGGDLDPLNRSIVRQPGTFPWRLLSSEEIRRYELEPDCPRIAENYGPQPAAGTLWGTWRRHPKIKDRFMDGYPDDLQVLAHDGGRRSARSGPEAIWVRVVAMEGDLLRGIILNQPHKLQSVSLGSEIQLLIVEGTELPILVTPRYLADRPGWIIEPCDKCGLAEMFDAPSDYSRAAFPDAPGDSLVAFTAFCPICTGVQSVEKKELHGISPSEAPAQKLAPAKPWWKFWN